MINQAIIVGKIKSIEISDDTTIYVETKNGEIPIKFASTIKKELFRLNLDNTIGIKGKITALENNIEIYAEKLTYIGMEVKS